MHVVTTDTGGKEELLISGGRSRQIKAQFMCKHCGHVQELESSDTRAGVADERGKGRTEKEAMVAAHVDPKVAGNGVVTLQRRFDSMGVACGSSMASSQAR